MLVFSLTRLGDKNSGEESPPSDWPVGTSAEVFSVIATWCRKTQSAVSVAVLRQVSPGCRRKVAERKPGQHSSVVAALSSCLEFCLGFPQ